MPQRLEPKFSILPAAQREIWTSLAAATQLNFVLYGGTAIALHLGHRESLDFDFFRSESLDKDQVRAAFGFARQAPILQDAPETLVVVDEMPAGSVKVSFFGGIGFGRVNDPLLTRDGTLLVASLDDLMATKLKAILDRAEAKDHRDIAAMISAGVSLPAGLSAFRQCSTANRRRSCVRSAISGMRIWICSAKTIKVCCDARAIKSAICQT
jgi:hypothetical protein